MIELYGQKYAKTESEFNDTLFAGGKTANGFYKVTKAGIYLSDMQGNERAFIRKDGLGPVSVSRPKCLDGKRFYSFAASTLDESWLCVPDSYMAKCEGSKALAESVFQTA